MASTGADAGKTVVRRFVDEVWNQGNLDVVDQVVAPDFAGHGHMGGQNASSGQQATRQFIQLCRTAFPDVHVTIEQQVAEGDLVATRWTLTGTHQGQFMNMAPTGRQVRVSGTVIDRISGGKVAEEWIDWDRLGLMEQLSAAQR